MPHHAPATVHQLSRRPCAQACRQPVPFIGTVLVGTSSFSVRKCSQQRRVALCAVPVDGPPGESSGAFIGATPGKAAVNKGKPGSESVQGGQGAGSGRVIDAAKSTDTWGKINPQEPKAADEFVQKPRLLDEAALTNWSERMKDTEEALESLEKRAKRKKVRGSWEAKEARQQQLQGVAVAPEWQSLRAGLSARAERDHRDDSEYLQSLSGDLSDDEFEEEFEEGGDDDMSEEEQQQAQPAAEPRPDFTTMQEVMPPPCCILLVASCMLGCP